MHRLQLSTQRNLLVHNRHKVEGWLAMQACALLQTSKTECVST